MRNLSKTIFICFVLWQILQFCHGIKIETKMNTCVNNAEENYLKVWDEECEYIGRKKDCKLPVFTANLLKTEKQRRIEFCEATYNN